MISKRLYESYPSKKSEKRTFRTILGRTVIAPILVASVSYGCTSSSEVGVGETSRITTTAPSNEEPAERFEPIPKSTISPENPVATDAQRSSTTVGAIEGSYPEHIFSHGDAIGADFKLTIGRTSSTIDLPIFAFTEADKDLVNDPILDLGGAAVTGDYPLNIFGFDERFVDENGNIRPMAIGLHRTSSHAAGRDIAMIELGNTSDRQGDILEYNGREYEAINMYLVADNNSEMLNELLGTFYPVETIFMFSCTEVNEGSSAAVDSAINGTYETVDPYLTAESKDPDGRILVAFQLVD